MLLDPPHTLSACTADDSRLDFIPRSGLLDMIRRDSGFAMRMLASLRLLPTAAGRAPASADDNRPGPPIAIELVAPKRLITRQLGLTPETLSRLFRELDQRGLVSMHGRTVWLNDVDGPGGLLNGSPLPLAASPA